MEIICPCLDWSWLGVWIKFRCGFPLWNEEVVNEVIITASCYIVSSVTGHKSGHLSCACPSNSPQAYSGARTQKASRNTGTAVTVE